MALSELEQRIATFQLAVTFPGAFQWFFQSVPIGYLVDPTTNSNDLYFKLYVLYYLQNLFIQFNEPVEARLIGQGDISGSGIVGPFNEAIGKVFLRAASPIPPPGVNRWFGSPNIYKLGEFAWISSHALDSTKQYQGELKFINFNEQFHKVPTGQSSFAFYYNLIPDVDMHYWAYAAPASNVYPIVNSQDFGAMYMNLLSGYAPGINE